MTAATCSNCGAPLGPEDRFCGECGAPVQSSDSGLEGAGTITDTTSTDQPGGLVRLIVLFAVILVALVIGIVATPITSSLSLLHTREGEIHVLLEAAILAALTAFVVGEITARVMNLEIRAPWGLPLLAIGFCGSMLRVLGREYLNQPIEIPWTATLVTACVLAALICGFQLLFEKRSPAAATSMPETKLALGPGRFLTRAVVALVALVVAFVLGPSIAEAILGGGDGPETIALLIFVVTVSGIVAAATTIFGLTLVQLVRSKTGSAKSEKSILSDISFAIWVGVAVAIFFVFAISR